jgi:transposase
MRSQKVYDFFMQVATEQLPNDVDSLKKVINDLTLKLLDITKKNDEKDNQIIFLEEKIKLLTHKLFGRSSEKCVEDRPEQQSLFNEAELGVDESGEKEEEKTIEVKGHRRKSKNAGRKPIAAHIPRNDIIIDLSEEEKKCKCCEKDRPCIGYDVTEEAEYEPAKITANRYIIYKYGPCDCEESKLEEACEIISAKMPPRMLPGSIASPNLLAHVLISKFADALPFYRQEKIFDRLGLHLPRATMSNWTISAAAKCKMLLDIMLEEARNGPLINMDETTVQVLKEPGRSPTGDSYMWVMLGRSNDKPIIFFYYNESRSGKVPLELLKDYEGYLQTDGYAGYDKVGALPNITHVGCTSHARRKFAEAFKTSKKKGSAKVGLAFIRRIYKEENIQREQLSNEEISKEEFVELRKKAIQPFLDKFKKWLNKKVIEVPPESLIGKAVNYTLNQWDKIIRFLDAWFLTPDNNIVENAIRPFVIGRKNWLFMYSPRGANASAGIYSLIETAKANGLEPFHYLKYIFTKLPLAVTKYDLKKLLPINLTMDDLKEEEVDPSNK